MKKSFVSLLSLILLAAVTGGVASSAQTSPRIYSVFDKASYGLLVKLPVQPGRRGEFLAMIKSRIVAARLQSGVVDFRVLSTPDPNVFLAIETFKDEQAFEVFEKLPESQSFLANIKPLLSGAVDATFLTPLP